MILSPKSSKSIYRNGNMGSSHISAAQFVPCKSPGSDTGALRWQNTARLYFMNSNQVCFTDCKALYVNICSKRDELPPLFRRLRTLPFLKYLAYSIKVVLGFLLLVRSYLQPSSVFRPVVEFLCFTCQCFEYFSDLVLLGNRTSIIFAILNLCHLSSKILFWN